MQVKLFDPNLYYSTKWYIFKNTTELGAIYDTLDWEGLSKLLPEKEIAPWLPFLA